MKLVLLSHADGDTLLVVDSADLLKYANDYKVVVSLCLYSVVEVCAAFDEFVNKGVQLRIL